MTKLTGAEVDSRRQSVSVDNFDRDPADRGSGGIADPVLGSRGLGRPANALMVFHRLIRSACKLRKPTFPPRFIGEQSMPVYLR